MRTLALGRHLSLVSLFPLLLSACSGSSDNAGPDSDAEVGYFESSADGNGRSSGGSKAGGPGSPLGSVTSGEEQAASDGDAAREIAEADIIQLQGSTLYAMSRAGGLSVIDVSKPAALKILGRYRTSFTPFEMYVKDGVVFAMYTDWGQFVQEAGSEEWSWKQTSALLALDVSDPSSIQKISHFDLPGEISDSRLVGDVLYAVSYQNGSCWDCSSKPATNVVSINVAKASAPTKVDELEFEDKGSQYGWGGKRSISVTPERIYVAGPEYGAQQPENSTIQVVDISDPAGDLVAGTTVKVRGQISSRWQMDEHLGTLRVVSQPWTWWNNQVAPALETFTVTSSQKIVKLGHLALKLPRPETLQSVRFDGERGYAVTFEQTDPLFTFDLSDPALPKQMGELEMPGFLYHMEPRGDRMIGLGYDQGNPDGALTVSIFDVTDLATPTMLKRVNFGGTWAQLPEDQDRIHKALKLDEENQLILVPFSGYQSDGEEWCGRALNGVQIIDWAGDALKLRGMTNSLGQARRAFIAGDALFTVADQEVAAYDISNRDKPTELSGAPLSLNVSLTLPTGDKLVRLRQDWYSADIRLEVVPQATPDALVASTTFNLTDYLRREHGLASCGEWYPANEPLFAVGDNVWALINDYGQWDQKGGYTKSRSLLVGFSSATGEVTGSLELPFQAGYWGWGNTSRVVRGDVAFLMQEGWDEAGGRRALAAVDLSDAAAPRLAYSLPLPATDYYASTGLLESGDELVTSYSQAVPNKENVVRHFALRIDVSEPLSPKLLGSINVPGYVIDFDASNDSAVTLDHKPLEIPGSSYEGCYAALPNSWFDESAGLCRGHSATLYRLDLVGGRARIAQTLNHNELAWTTPRRADGRLFFTGGSYGYALGGVATSDGGYFGGWAWATQNVTVVDSANLAHSKLEAPGVWNVVPSGKSLILAPSAGQPLTIIDATDAEAPELRSTEETALGFTQHVSVSGNDVYLSQGDGGVQRMTLP